MKDKINQFVVDANFIFQSLASNSNDYIYIWDFNLGSYVVSPNLAEDFSIPKEGENFKKVWHAFIYARDIERVEETIEQQIKAKKTKINLEYQVTNVSGHYIWLSDKSTVRYNSVGEPELVIGIMHNLAYDGKVDSVTGLLTHNKCKEIFDLLQNSKNDNYGSMMLLGIDDFTSINTLNNHSFGDLVLRSTAQAILNLLPDDNTSMYRFDGDQLLIIADKVKKAELTLLYQKIKEYTAQSHEIQGKPYRLTMSAGIVGYPEDGFTWVDLEKAVSITLKKAKEMGKNHCIEFTHEFLEERLYQQSLGHYLAESVENHFDGFRVVFQPVCNAQDLHIKGAEILLRFITPEGNLINPNDFIPLLEHSQLIIPVGFWVLEQAIKTCKKWTYYIKDFIVNVNVSYLQLRDASFCDKVEELLEKYDLDIKHLTLELTESYFITDAPNINLSMRRLEELHLQVAMDDFGTGYSSLARLSQFNVDIVKIDRMFVQSLHKSKYNHDFVDSVVRLCHNVGMKVCVEGVETREEQASICLLNVDYIQGFYVSKPIEEELFFTTFIAQSNPNDDLIVIPDMQLRHDQLVGDKDVLLAMMDATPLGLNFWNRDAEIIACNIEVLNLFDATDFIDFKNNFEQFSPECQPDGKNSMKKAKELIALAFTGQRIKLYWQHCRRNGEMIPTEVILVRIPYMNDYIIASYTRDMREQVAMEQKVKKFNIRLKAILDSTPLCLNLWDKDYQNIMCNKEAISLFNLNDEKEYTERFFDLSPEYQPDGCLSNEKALNCIKEAFITGRKQFFWMHHNLEGTEIPSEITLVRIEGLGEDGSDLVAGYTRDIRSQLAAQKIQQTASQRIRVVLDSMPLACVLWTSNMKIIDCNEVIVNMFAADNKEEVMGHFDSFNPLKQPDGSSSKIKKKQKFAELEEKNSDSFEWVYRNKLGEEVPCEVTLVKIKLENEDMIVAYSRDLRELHHTLEVNDRLEKIAYSDLLTGVASRARFVEKLEENFNLLSPTDKFALIIFDIDRFKLVNDTYGHQAGDLVLKRIAKSIEKSIPKDALLGRLGGDEFIIQLKNISKEELQELMNEMVQSIANIRFSYNRQTFQASISMGASYKLAEDKNYHQLLGRADKALYHSKAMGRSQGSIL